MSFVIVPAAEIPLAQQAAVANRAFADYVAGWKKLDAASLTSFLCHQGIDLFYSRFLRTAAGLVGLGYINRTGDISRLATLAVEPSARGTGGAAHLLQHLCAEARQRGEPAMVLEVIQQNPRAYAFYLRAGFRALGRLEGWRLPSAANLPANGAAVEEISIMEAINSHAAICYPELPWSISGFAIAKVAGVHAYRHGDTSVVLSNPAVDGPIRVHGIFSAIENWPARRQALAATLQRFSEREFFAVPVFPEVFGAELFAPLGFTREKLTQSLMRRDYEITRATLA